MRQPGAMEILEEGEFQALIHKLCAVHKKESLGKRTAVVVVTRRFLVTVVPQFGIAKLMRLESSNFAFGFGFSIHGDYNPANITGGVLPYGPCEMQVLS